jgi:hypothetical protein
VTEPTGWIPPPPPPLPDSAEAVERHWLWPVSIILLALVLLLSLTGGALLVRSQQGEIRALERDLTQVRAELEATREELTAAREELAAARADADTDTDTGAPDSPDSDGGGFGGLLDDLLEGFGGLGELQDLLEGFGGLGDGGPGGNPSVLACLQDALAPQGGVQPVPSGSAPEQVAAIAERVEEIRGLTFDGEVDARFLDSAAFSAEVRAAFDSDYPASDADLDERLLVALGAIPADFDLREGYLDLIAGQAAGFYSTDTTEIVVLADDPDAPLSPAEQVTLAHELEHALSDERLGLPELGDAGTDGDGARASLALVEGGATLAMQQFAGRSLGPMEQLGMGLDPSAAAAQAQLQQFPVYLQRDLIFPYEEGLAFACGIHAAGGWPAVDATYVDLPTTSAQILWPERYAAGEAAAAPRPFGGPPAGFREARATTVGAADLLWLFEAPGDDTAATLDDPRGRAAAWAGGTVRLLTRGQDNVVSIALVQRPGERDLCGSIVDWYRAAFPGDAEVPTEPDERIAVDGTAQDAVVICADDEVRLGIGPDLASARAAAA